MMIDIQYLILHTHTHTHNYTTFLLLNFIKQNGLVFFMNMMYLN